MTDNRINVTTRTRDQWEIEDDVRTLERAADIQGDPQRVRDAQNLIKQKRERDTAILGIPVPPEVPGRKNPATIMPLNPKF